MKNRKTVIIILIIIAILWMFNCCRIGMPKKKGHILTPNGLVDKNLLTKPERKEYKEWSKETYKEGQLKK